VTGLTAQVLLLAGLAATVGLHADGWLAGLTYALMTCVTLAAGMARGGVTGFGPADWVTLARATLVGCVAALTAESFRWPVPVAVLVGLTVVALALDAVDGWVARGTGTASPLGARFDMEVDAFLLLALSVYVARSFGPWVLAIGGMRYAFVVATWLLPWMRAPLPPRYWRKVVAAVQGIVLVVAAADVLPAAVIITALVLSLSLLLESFGRDVLWLWRRRLTRTAPEPIPR
jgi:phosphatidylglycerophosphate synthase